MTFTANVNGGSQTNPTYDWTVSAGSIESGQGTPVITVRAPSDGTTNVTATVNIGNLCASCPSTASETAPVTPPKTPFKADEFGPLKDDDVKAVVLRINSPGGCVTATDMMWRDLQAFRAKTRRPVIAAISQDWLWPVCPQIESRFRSSSSK